MCNELHTLHMHEFRYNQRERHLCENVFKMCITLYLLKNR